MNTPAPQVEMVSELQRLSELATAGPWSTYPDRDNIFVAGEYGYNIGSVSNFNHHPQNQANADFIAALVNWFRENQAALNARAGGDAYHRIPGLQGIGDAYDYLIRNPADEYAQRRLRECLDNFAALASQAAGVK